ncbi:cistern family PEP-CTERM protein [Novosphingobium tardum]|jgi:hypothetical protein|uniref:Cistern family PEP-CTERM protein n=1 Tax=Novosphingobium tardum TaxID=1538021 RepID=A0ABV8RSE8_9SPHN
MLTCRNLAMAFAGAAILAATPAWADAITLDSGDIGQTFSLTYNGFSDGTTVDGLTGSTSFKLTGIDGNTYNFDYSVTNTTSAPLTSRISSFAFNTNPDITSATSTGAYAYPTVSSSYPNGIGSVDVCFKDAATGACSGGGSGGIAQNQTGTGSFSLNFSQPVSSLTLSDFYIRYQSITGAGNISSASGSGTMTSTGGTPVPEPGMLGLFGLGLIGIALMRRRRAAPQVRTRVAYA